MVRFCLLDSFFVFFLLVRFCFYFVPIVFTKLWIGLPVDWIGPPSLDLEGGRRPAQVLKYFSTVPVGSK